MNFFPKIRIPVRVRWHICQNTNLKRLTGIVSGSPQYSHTNSILRQFHSSSTKLCYMMCPCSNALLINLNRYSSFNKNRRFSDSTTSSSFLNNLCSQENGQVSPIFQLKPADVLEFSNDQVKDKLSKDMIVYEDFLSIEEENSLMAEIHPYMNKLRYEYDHWDDAIHGYRETEKRHWNDANQAIIQRVRDLAFPPNVPETQLAYVHILDLEKKGYIKPHIDSIRFCGNTVSGLSLLSDSIMRLVHTENSDLWINILLRKRSLYIMRDVARYEYKHEILNDEQSFYKGEHIPRERRVSVICRNEATDLGGFPTDPSSTDPSSVQ